MLAGGKAWLGGLKGRGLPVSHQVGHVSAVAAEDFYFLFFCWDAQGTKQLAWGKGGQSCQAVLNWRCGGLGRGFSWTLDSLVVPLSREEGRLKRLNLYLGNVCLCGQLPLGARAHVFLMQMVSV